MHALFEFIEEGCSPGEAFVRADISLNYSRGLRSGKGWQNPRALLRKENGDVLKVSSVLHDVSAERGIV